MAVPIKAGMEKVPGGLMLVPLLVGAVIHTAAPDAGKFFGSFTGALFTGLAPILVVKGERERMIPMTMVKEVDTAGGKVTVELLPGMDEV